MGALSTAELEMAATAYEEMLVPALFAPWAERVSDEARLRPGQRVVDVACGTGVLARAAARRVGPRGSVTGVDVNPGMLAQAERLAPGIAWCPGDAELLPFEDGTFDAVLSQFGLMFFSNREASLQEMLRVLSPGGRMTIAVFDVLEKVPAYHALAELFERHAGSVAAEALRSPFSLGNTQAIRSLFSTSGVYPLIETHELLARFPSVTEVVLADVEGWFPVAGIHLAHPALTALLSEAETVLAPYVNDRGEVEFAVRAHIATATKQ